MGLRSPTREERIAVTRGTGGDCAAHERDRVGRQPLLGAERRGEEEARNQPRRGSHLRKILPLAVMVVFAACSRNAFVAPAVDRAETIRSGPPIPVDQAWILDQSGPTATDTTVRFDPAKPRTVMLRHGSPDNAIYAIVDVPAGAITPGPGDSASITIHPTPGRYEITISTVGALTAPLLVTFSYATHFQAPSDALARYPSPTRFDQAMGAGVLEDPGMIRFLPTTRPAADLMQFAVSAPGTFLLAAPK